MTIEDFIIWLVIGGIAGWLAGLIVKGYGLGLVGNWCLQSATLRLTATRLSGNNSIRNYNFDSRGTVATNSVPGFERCTWIAAFNCFESARTIRIPSPGAECGSKSAGSP